MTLTDDAEVFKENNGKEKIFSDNSENVLILNLSVVKCEIENELSKVAKAP